MEDDMKLPEGKTCANCFHLQKCVELFGGDPSYLYCSFSPRRFAEKKATDKNYALVELMGRQQIAGFVSDVMVEGKPCIKVEVPETTANRKYACYFNIESVYAISPIGEAQAMNLTSTRVRGRFPEKASEAVVNLSTILLKGHGQLKVSRVKRLK